MNIVIKRKWFSDKSTVGQMYLDGNFECYTLEDTVRDSVKVAGSTAIPVGQYEVIINFSQRFNRQMPLLLNVPGFDGIRIHEGNTDRDTEGCILVGEDFDQKNLDFIGNSKRAFDLFLPKLETSLKTGKVLLNIS